MIGIDSGGGDVSVKFASGTARAAKYRRRHELSFPNGFTPAPHVIGEHGGAR